jgi:hypothetical protein
VYSPPPTSAHLTWAATAVEDSRSARRVDSPPLRSLRARSQRMVVVRGSANRAGDPDVSEVHSDVEHGGDVGVAEQVRVGGTCRGVLGGVRPCG